MPDIWAADQYLRFADQRLRPFLDLVERAGSTGSGKTPPRRIVDLGCGPGNATALLAERWPEAHVLGVDSSPAMIEEANTRQISGRLDFELGDLREWQPDRAFDAAAAASGSGPGCDSASDSVSASGPDLILANAVLQWVPGHLDVFTRLAGTVPSGGTIGMQVPGNFGSPSHTLLAELAKSARWRDKMPPNLERPAAHDPEMYLDALEHAGLAPDVWETTYLHLVDGETGVSDFVRGTALRPITTRLSPDDAAAFTTEYQALVVEAYPPRRTGDRVTQVLPFRRIFAVGHRA